MNNRVLIGIGALLLAAAGALFYYGTDFAPKPVEPPPPAAKKTEAPVAPAPTPALPSFDVVRVEPNGDLVVGGRAAPGSKVELLADQRMIDTTKVAETGQFAMVPPPLPGGTHTLSLLMTLADGRAVPSQQTVTVDVPQGAKGPVLVTRAEPGKATEVLSSTPQTAAASSSSGESGRARVGITVVEADDKGALYVGGTAAPSAPVRLYLNDSFVAGGDAAPTGAWSFKVEKGVVPGQYRVRVDEAEATSGKVLSRAEVTFDMPAVGSGGSTLSSSSQTVTVPSVETATVVRGDSLWRISRKTYGSGYRYTEIHDANRDQIRDPDLIYPGQIFVLPNLQ